jgi:hypothetical protein
MERQGGQSQLEQSDMRLALNIVRMATGWFLHTTIEESTYLVMQTSAAVLETQLWAVGICGLNHVKAAIEGHTVVFCQNPKDGYLT